MEKTDFQNYRSLGREVKELKAKLKALCDPSGQRYTLAPRAPSGHGRTMDDLAAIYEAQEAHYLAKIVEKEAWLLAMEQAIESLADPDERLIMRYRYIDGHLWPKVAQLMLPLGVSERQTYRLHGRALERLKER